MDQEPRIVVAVEKGVAHLRLNDPASLNALSASLGFELRDAVADLGEDDNVRCMVITGTGQGFCAGGDVQSFYDARFDPEDTMRATLDGIHGAIATIMAAPFPTIAAINGVVAGAGMGLALATDLAIASDAAVFTMAYTGIGVSPDASSTFSLPRLVGNRRAMHMILTNERISAAEAVAIGMINAAVPHDELHDHVSAVAHKLAVGPTKAYVRARELILASTTNDATTQMELEADGILAAGRTADFREGVEAFIEKRRAEFSGS